MFKIVYIFVCCLIAIGLLFAISRGFIQGENIFFIIWVMFFYVLGVTVGVAFLILNIMFFIKGKEFVFLVLSVVSFLWVISSVIIWIKTGGIM